MGRILVSPKQEPTVVYNQKLDTSAKLFNTYQNRDAALVAKLRELVQNKHSVMLFAEDINEAERIYQLLQENKFMKIQAFTQAGVSKTESAPALPIILEKSGLEEMITVTTACGGRALNFEAEVGILLSSSFTRHQEQMLGRIARNGKKGATFAYFSMEDFTFSNDFSFDDWHNETKVSDFLDDDKNLKNIIALNNRYNLIDFTKQINNKKKLYDPDNLDQNDIATIKKHCQKEIDSMVLPFLLHLEQLEKEETLKIKRAINGCKQIPEAHPLKKHESQEQVPCETGKKSNSVVHFFNQATRPTFVESGPNFITKQTYE